MLQIFRPILLGQLHLQRLPYRVSLWKKLCQLLIGQAKEPFKSFIINLLIQQHLVQQFWRPMNGLQNHMLIWRPSLPKYNFRMAQVMQWPPTIRNYMRKVRSKYQHVCSNFGGFVLIIITTVKTSYNLQCYNLQDVCTCAYITTILIHDFITILILVTCYHTPPFLNKLISLEACGFLQDFV